MIKHPIRNFFGLTVLYIVIIFGIFLLQFRSESSISTTFGALRLQLAEVQNQQQEKTLKNVFQVAFRGLVLSGDEQNPVMLEYKDGTQTAAVLTDWNKNSDLSCTLKFDSDVELLFSVSGTDSTAGLEIQATLPKDVASVSIPYKPAGGYLVTERTQHRAIISSKNQEYKAEAWSIKENNLILSSKDSVASYDVFDSSSIFDYASVHGIELATLESYGLTLRQFKTDFIQLFERSSTATLPEQTIVSYVAAMAENGDYNKAVASIPSSVKTSDRRTYLSAPYFNSLVAMNNSLIVYLNNNMGMIDYALLQKSLDVFSVHDFAEILCIADAKKAMSLAELPASLPDFEPTPVQAAGIIKTFIDLSKLNMTLAKPLETVIEKCLEVIALSCTLEADKLTVSANDERLSLVESVYIGNTLVEYGTHIENDDYSATGYLLLNTYLMGNQELAGNLPLMGELYPILVTDNTYYPHIRILASAAESGTGKVAWAWTISESMSYKRDELGNLTLSIDFPVGSTQYIIVNGIKSFRRIDIYNVSFRTDPRFETYKSSGYVYNSSLETLFLKSEQRSAIEDVKLYYSTVATEPKPAAKEEKPASAEKSASSENASTSTATSNAAAAETAGESPAGNSTVTE